MDELWNQGELRILLAEIVCPVCGLKGVLRLMRGGKQRGVVWAREDGLVHETIWVPLVRCDGGGKRHWHRVLSQEIQPGKTYSTPAQETVLQQYDGGQVGLRQAVGAVKVLSPAARPNYTTLWRWLGGLGQYGRGRETPPEALPIGAVREETRRHGHPGLPELWRQTRHVPVERYRSERRREELEYALRVLGTAAELFPEESFPVTAWSSLMLGVGFCAGLGWFTAKVKTGIQLSPPDEVAVGFESSEKPPRKEKTCPPRTRSPPGASSR